MRGYRHIAFHTKLWSNIDWFEVFNILRRKAMRTILILILAVLFAGCAMRFETRGLTPNTARVLDDAVVGAYKELCKNGVLSEKRAERVIAPLPQNPREYPPVFPPPFSSETKSEVKCK